VTERSTTRYARSGDANIAYQVTGDGPFELKGVPGEWRLYAVGG
jgi:hypothetical protein